MPITRTAMVDDDGSGTSGTILNNAWKQEFYNQIDGYAGGAWANVPHTAGNFAVGQGTGTWTVSAANQKTYCFAIFNTATVFVAFQIEASVIAGGSPIALVITLPGAIAPPSRAIIVPFAYSGAAQNGTGIAAIEPPLLRIRLLKDIMGTPFAADANFFVMGELFIPY